GHRDAAAQRPWGDAGRRQRLERRPDRRARGLDEAVLEDGGAVVAVDVERVRPYRADWKRGGVTSWLTTVDHKRIGILYIGTSLVFFALGGILALLIRTQLLTPDESFLTKNSYNEVVTIHGTT